MRTNRLTQLAWVEHRISPRVFSDLSAWAETVRSQNFAGLRSHRQELVGQIEHQYALPAAQQELLFPEIQALTDYYLTECWIDWQRPRPNKLWLTDAWINFQQQHEFNPVHAHRGLLSWVLWLRLPAESTNQSLQLAAGRTVRPLRSYFEFIYADANQLGGINRRSLNLTQEHAGLMIMFPSQIMHAVTPFAEADWRISISGNVHDAAEWELQQKFQQFVKQ